MSIFAAFQRLVPRWLSEGDGGGVLGSIALMLDDYAARAKLGLLARFPSYAPDAVALGALGRDRRIQRGIGEATDAYAARIVRAFDDLQVRGNPYALLAQVQAYLGVPCVVRTVDRRGNWYSIAADGTRSTNASAPAWAWDGVPASPYWGRFWLVIFPVGGTLPWTYTGLFGAVGAVAESETLGTTATCAEVSALRSIVREWKPAGVTCEWIVVSYDGAEFVFDNPTATDGLWGDWSKVSAGVRVASRFANARYFSGAE